VNADHTLNTDPRSFASNFQSISKLNCVQCHVAGQAGDRCTSCHNYHIGTFTPFTAPRGLFPAFDAAGKQRPRS